MNDRRLNAAFKADTPIQASAAGRRQHQRQQPEDGATIACVVGSLLCLALFDQINLSGRPGAATAARLRNAGPEEESVIVEQLAESKVCELRGRELDCLATHRARLICESRFAQDVSKVIAEAERQQKLHDENVRSLFTNERGKALTWSSDGVKDFESLCDECSDDQSSAWLEYGDTGGRWRGSLRREWQIVNENIRHALDLPPLDDIDSPRGFHEQLLVLRTVAGRLIKTYRNHRHDIEKAVNYYGSGGRKGAATLHVAIGQLRENERKERLAALNTTLVPLHVSSEAPSTLQAAGPLHEQQPDPRLAVLNVTLAPIDVSGGARSSNAVRSGSSSLAALCEQLDALAIPFPGTRLRLRLAVQIEKPITA